MRCSSFFGALLVALPALAGCPTTIPCEPGFVGSTEGCIPDDGGMPDGGTADGGDAAMTPDAGADTCIATTVYPDTDEDGHGDMAMATEACEAPMGFVALGDDCDDTTDLRYPGLTETCDGVDNDCDEMIDSTFECAMGASTGCTTSCGSTGTGTCSATCTTPPAAECTAPVEACNGGDDDCDGLTDEGPQVLGPERNLGSTLGRVVVVRLSTNGHVVFTHRSTGIIAQRFDRDDVPVGTEVVITTTLTDEFDATMDDSNRIFVSWVQGETIQGAVYHEDLSVLTAPRAIHGTLNIDSATLSVRVAAAGTSALMVFYDGGGGSTIRARTCSFPGLSCANVTIPALGTMDADIEIATDPLFLRAYVTYRLSTGLGRVSTIGLDGTFISSTPVALVGTNPSNLVPEFMFSGSRSELQLGITWREDPSGTASDRVRFALYQISLPDGVLIAVDSINLVPSGYAAPISARDPLAIASNGGRWFVSQLTGTTTGTMTASTWSVVEVVQPASGPLRVIPTATVSASLSENRSTSIAPGSGASVFVAASRTDGSGRAYRIGCP